MTPLETLSEQLRVISDKVFPIPSRGETTYLMQTDPLGKLSRLSSILDELKIKRTGYVDLDNVSVEDLSTGGVMLGQLINLRPGDQWGNGWFAWLQTSAPSGASIAAAMPIDRLARVAAQVAGEQRAAALGNKKSFPWLPIGIVTAVVTLGILGTSAAVTLVWSRKR